MLAGLSGATAAAGCANSPGSQPIVGPDGSSMAHVHCGADQGACFRIAGELCPSGYEIKPVLLRQDGNFLVRCRSARPTLSVAAHAPMPAPDGAAPALMYPWPPPEVGAAVQRSYTPSASPASEIDLGY